MNEYIDWQQGSKMPAIYVYLSGRNIDDKILKMKGLKKPDKAQQQESAVKQCSRCGHVNPPTWRYCMKCALPLDLKAALEVEDKRKRKDKVLSTIMQDSEVQDLMVRKIKEYGLDLCSMSAGRVSPSSTSVGPVSN
jgi:ribosomal protein L40E